MLKNSKAKIKAFTITEILIVMVISAIVAGLAFSVLNLLQRNLYGISKNYGYKTDIQLLEQALKIDFNKFTQVNWNENEQELFLNSPISNKTYQFYKDSIVNEQRTYKLTTFDKSFFFKGNKISSGEIDALKFYFNKNKELNNVFIYKINDITTYFRNGNKTN